MLDKNSYFGKLITKTNIMLNHFNKALLLTMLSSASVAYSQRVTEDFNKDWKFFQPRNETFNFNFDNGQDFKPSNMIFGKVLRFPILLTKMICSGIITFIPEMYYIRKIYTK